MENEILNFWKHKNKYPYDDIEKLKSDIRDFYTNEFVENFSKWNGILLETNTMINEFFIDTYPLIKYTDMTFNYFCQTINELIENWINENNDIQPADIAIVTQQLINKYVIELTSNITNNEQAQKNYAITTLLNSIKKVVYY